MSRHRGTSQFSQPNLQQIIHPSQLQVIQTVHPPPRSSSQLYSPPCAQYQGFSPGGIIRQGGVIYGNCSPNTNNNPFAGPYDFQCRNGLCVGTNGVSGPSPNQVCCPQLNPSWWYQTSPPPHQPHHHPHTQCCQQPDVNSCALCLDQFQHTTSAAQHFANIETCRRGCPFL